MARHERIPHCGREPRELVRVSRRRDVSAVSEVVDEPQEKHVEERAAARPPRQACLLLDQLAKIADGRRAQVIWRSSVERRSTEVSDNDATALGTLPSSRLGTYDVATLCSASVLLPLASHLALIKAERDFGRTGIDR